MTDTTANHSSDAAPVQQEKLQKSDTEQFGFQHEKHVKYFLHCLFNGLPEPYQSQDSTRVTLMYFCVAALDLLGYEFSTEQKHMLIEWIYAQQVTAGAESGHAGFRGGPYFKASYAAAAAECCDHDHAEGDCNCFHAYDFGHLTMTYTALAMLRILGDNLERVDKKAIALSMRKLQSEETGGYFATVARSEQDVRFLYSACAVCALMQDWSGIDIDLALKFLESIQSTADFAFAHNTGLESHGGSSYCAISSYRLIQAHRGEANKPLPHEREMAEWLLRRQISGFQGRPQKDADTCYSFWVGAGLTQLLGNALRQFADRESSVRFTMSCQHPKYGGIAKCPENPPDVLHAYLSLAGLSLIGFDCLKPLCPSLNISRKACESWMDDA